MFHRVFPFLLQWKSRWCVLKKPSPVAGKFVLEFISSALLWSWLWASRCHIVLAVPRASFVCTPVICSSVFGQPNLMLMFHCSSCFEVNNKKWTLLAQFQNFANLAPVFTVLFARLDARLTDAHYWYTYHAYACTLSVRKKHKILGFRCDSALNNRHCTEWPRIVQWPVDQRTLTEWCPFFFK